MLLRLYAYRECVEKTEVRHPAHMYTYKLAHREREREEDESAKSEGEKRTDAYEESKWYLFPFFYFGSDARLRRASHIHTSVHCFNNMHSSRLRMSLEEKK